MSNLLTDQTLPWKIGRLVTTIDDSFWDMGGSFDGFHHPSAQLPEPHSNHGGR